jgi:hypothetical protein
LLVVKAAGLVVFGISTELIEHAENRYLREALQTIMDILHKPVVPVIFGSNMKWKESEIGIKLTDTLYVNMQDPKRYDNRINELVDHIENGLGSNKESQKLRDQPTDVFISYCWLNSHDALSKGLPICC